MFAVAFPGVTGRSRRTATETPLKGEKRPAGKLLTLISARAAAVLVRALTIDLEIWAKDRLAMVNSENG